MGFIKDYPNDITIDPGDKLLGSDQAAGSTRNYQISDLTTYFNSNFDYTSSIASQPEAEAGTDNTKIMTPLRTNEAIQALQSVFGSQYQYSENVATQTNNTGTLAEYLALNTPVIPTGTYKVEWMYHWRKDSANNDFVGEIQTDGVNAYPVQHFQEIKDNGADQRNIASGSYDVTFGSDAAHIFRILFASNGGNTSTVFYGNIRVFRVA